MDLEAPDPFFNLLCLPDLVRPPTWPTRWPCTTPTRWRSMPRRRASARTSTPSSSSTRRPTSSTSAPPRRGSRPDRALRPVTPAPGSRTSASTIRWSPARSARIRPRARSPASSRAPTGRSASGRRRQGPRRSWPASTARPWCCPTRSTGLLNPLGLNVIRQFPIYGTVAFGSRTVDGSNALGSEWKYIPVRRTAELHPAQPARGAALGRAQAERRGAVVAAAGERARRSCRACSARARSRAVSAREAYFVACDASTTTQRRHRRGNRQHRHRLRAAEAGRVRRDQPAPDRAAGRLREARDGTVLGQRTAPRPVQELQVPREVGRSVRRRRVEGLAAQAHHRSRQAPLGRRSVDVASSRPAAPSTTRSRSSAGSPTTRTSSSGPTRSGTSASGAGGEVSLADFRKDIIIELLNEAGQVVLVLRRLPLLGLGVPGAARPRRQRQRGGHRQAQARERGLGARLRRASSPTSPPSSSPERHAAGPARSDLVRWWPPRPRRPPTSGCPRCSPRSTAATRASYTLGSHHQRSLAMHRAVVGTPLEAVVDVPALRRRQRVRRARRPDPASCRRRSHRPSWRSR